jgi:hypothetical protein
VVERPRAPGRFAIDPAHRAIGSYGCPLDARSRRESAFCSGPASPFLPDPETASGGPDPETASGGPDPETASGGPDPETASGGPDPETASEGPDPETASGGPDPALSFSASSRDDWPCGVNPVATTLGALERPRSARSNPKS